MTVFAAMLMLIVANSFFIDHIQQTVPWNANDAVRDIGRFQAFAAAAELYMRANSGLAADTTVDAATILANAKGLPPAISSLASSINSSWKIKTLGGGEYILCTGMTPAGIAAMTQFPKSPLWNPAIAWQQGNTTITNGSNTAEAVTFDVSSAIAQKCI